MSGGWGIHGVERNSALLDTGHMPHMTTSGYAVAGARLADRPADYEALGLPRRGIALWEDAFRTAPGAPGTWEWWYFDAQLDDGSQLMIVFYAKEVGHEPSGVSRPFVTLELDRPDGTRVETRAEAGEGDYAFSTDRCEVRIGSSAFSGDLHDYRIHVEAEDVTADVTLTGSTPPWRPGTGHLFFGDDEGRYIAWLPAIPHGEVEATLRLGGPDPGEAGPGQGERLAGHGYHDHTWGNASLSTLVSHWYRARAAAGPYTVIASHLTAGSRYGHAVVPLFLLTRGGRTIADDGALVYIHTSGEHDDRDTGRPIADTVVYEYRAVDPADDGYRVTFSQDGAAEPASEHSRGFQHVLARLAGLEGAYLRFSGRAKIERLSGGQTAEEHSTHATWELVYPGDDDPA